MQKWRIACIVMMLCAVKDMNAQTTSYNDRAKKYIEQFRQLAIEEQRRSGIPAAITLAQGIHETAAGNSELATNANNHFGIKCKKEWKGETYKYTDDAPDECFRKYSSPEQSYRDHSDYLSTAPRYASLFALSKTDYAGWATGLKRCGYATNPKYAQLLIKLVEEYKLQDYTYVAMSQGDNQFKESAQKIKEIRTANNGEIIPNEDVNPRSLTASIKSDEYAPQVNKSKKKGMQVSYGDEAKEVKAETETYAENPEKPEFGQLVKVNGLRAIYVKKGTVLLNEAFKYNIRYAKLLELNDLVDGPLEADMYVYLEKKNPRGVHATHVVKPGETISQIAQAEGMQLKFLKYYNHFGSNEEPVAGAVLQLQQYTEVKPETYVKVVAPREEASFAGSSPKAVPLGATRTRASYISKKDIAKAAAPAEKKAKATPKEETVAIEKEPAVEELAKEESAEISQSEEAPFIAAAKQETVMSKQEEPVFQSEPIAKVEEEKTTDEQPILPQTPVSTAELVETKEDPKDVETEVSKAAETTAEVAKEEEVKAVQVEQSKEEAPKATENEAKATETAAAPEVSSKEATPVEEVPAEASTAPAKPDAVGTEKADVTEPAKEGTLSENADETKPTEEEKPAEEEPKEPEGPQDEFSRLKRQLDKVVYASDKVASNQPAPAKAVETKEEKKAEKKAEEAPAKAEDEAKMYTVKKGDTAFSIAKKHKITMDQLNEWNKLESKAVKVGQKLRVK